ncbi:MAG: biopolymer transporter ExbD [Rhodoferax sp.]|nr:biopolymer transporter ExbD [Rhodoferax sp.]
MNFRHRNREEPEINLIPFIDVLLVVLIFLMLSTTYSKFTELQIILPVADAETARDRAREVLVGVNWDGAYTVNKTPVAGRTVEALARALSSSSGAGSDTVLLISADASARHQAVVTVMEAARKAGLTQITFATQAPGTGQNPGP